MTVLNGQTSTGQTLTGQNCAETQRAVGRCEPVGMRVSMMVKVAS